MPEVFLLHRLKAGSTGKMAKHSMWHSIQKCPFLEAAIPDDILFCLVFFFQKEWNNDI